MNSVLVSHLIFPESSQTSPSYKTVVGLLSHYFRSVSFPPTQNFLFFVFTFLLSLSLSLKHSHITHRYTLTKTTIEADATVVSNHCLIYLFSQKTRKIKKKNKMYSIKEKVTEKLSRLFADSPNNSVSSPYDDPQVLFFFFLNQFSDLFVYFTYYVF